MPSKPFMKFYIADWMSERTFVSVSLAGRGLWIELLCRMHDSPRRGYLLQANGQPYTHELIARDAKCRLDGVANLVQELLDSGTASATPDGILYCRKMVREEKKRKRCADNGKRGGRPKNPNGNPNGNLNENLNGNPDENLNGNLNENPNSNPNQKPNKSPIAIDSSFCNYSTESECSGDGGAGEGVVPFRQTDDCSAEGLAEEFRYYHRGIESRATDLDGLTGEFRDMLQGGLDGPSLLAEIRRANRPKAEPIWEFRKRVKTLGMTVKIAPKPWAERVAEANRRMDAQAANFR